MGESSESFSTPEDEGPREYQATDSDSDGPILYTDDDEEEDEDEDGSGESKTVFKRYRGEWVVDRGSYMLSRVKVSLETRQVMFSCPSSSFLYMATLKFSL
jgi:hypothetical protein